MSENTKWDLVIEPRSKLFSLHLNDVWRYRDLLLLLVRRDFVAFYKQTIFGPIWFFVQPVLTTIMFSIIFGQIAKIPTDGVPPYLFYLTGIVCWNYFAECLNKTSTVFKDNAQMFGKVYFPRLIMPLSIILSNLLKFGVQFLLFIGVYFYYLCNSAVSIHPDYTYLALFPFLIILMAAMGLGIGMIISALTNKYRDLSFLVTFGVQLFMYATPVAYPLSAAPAKLKLFIGLNPMTPIIEWMRYGFMGKGTHDWSQMSYCIVVTTVLFVLGMVIFNKVEKNFVDTV